MSIENPRLRIFDLYKKLKTETPAVFICIKIRALNKAFLYHYIIGASYYFYWNKQLGGGCIWVYTNLKDYEEK